MHNLKQINEFRNDLIIFSNQQQYGANVIDSYYNCKTCAYWLTEAMYQCPEKSCKQCFSSIRKYVHCVHTHTTNEIFTHFTLLFFCFSFVSSHSYNSINGDYKALNSSGGGSGVGSVGVELRTGRDNYEVPKCCDNILKTPTELITPLNRCVPRRDEDIIECQFSVCGCNFRTIDRSKLTVHNEENIHRHMSVSFGCIALNKWVK